ncbi:MAG: hypothetical protein M3R69_01905 [Acidobacteriota bacterium]|nr:hypothetical protein [Acidobacteriota bacterium]
MIIPKKVEITGMGVSYTSFASPVRSSQEKRRYDERYFVVSKDVESNGWA